MGASLVTQVLANWSHVSDRAFRVLVRMAVTALDNPQNGRPAAVYHGGRELLAMSLRSKGGTERTRFRSVAEAVAELTEAGAIEHIAIGWAGQNAVYRLTLGRTRRAEKDGPTAHPLAAEDSPDGDGMGGPTAHPMDGPRAHPMDVPTARKWMGPGHTPRNQEEPVEELTEEPAGVDLPATSRSQGAPKPTPNRCPRHEIPLKPRTDGEQACGFCRREQRVEPRKPDPPPGELAPVIQLRPREAS